MSNNCVILLKTSVLIPTRKKKSYDFLFRLFCYYDNTVNKTYCSNFYRFWDTKNIYKNNYMYYFARTVTG